MCSGKLEEEEGYAELQLNTRSVPRSKHTASVL